MTKGDDLHHRFVATLVAIAALLSLVQFASAQTCSATQACADTTLCCSQYGYCGNTAAYCGQGCQNGPCTGGTAPAPPAGGSGWSSFLTKDVFEGFFPGHNAFYTYENFVAAAGAYSDFGSSGTSLLNQKRELAAFLANVKQETGGLVYIEEIDQSDPHCDPNSSAQYPCAPGKKYYGRGALQLSWNYNYGACSEALNLGTGLLTNPDQVAQDGVLAFKTALWFWMTGSNCHSAILGGSFSGTIRAINPAYECGQAEGSVGSIQMNNRVTYYKDLCSTLGVDPGTDLTC